MSFWRSEIMKQSFLAGSKPPLRGGARAPGVRRAASVSVPGALPGGSRLPLARKPGPSLVPAILAWACIAAISFAAEKPNVVFILADDLGYADLACYGHPYARTPALDNLAREGTAFRNFHVTGVTCCPS